MPTSASNAPYAESKNIYLFRLFDLDFEAPPLATVSTLASREVPLGVPLTPLMALFCNHKSALPLFRLTLTQGNLNIP